MDRLPSFLLPSQSPCPSLQPISSPLSCHPTWTPHFSVRATQASPLLSSLIPTFPLFSSPNLLPLSLPHPLLFPSVSSLSKSPLSGSPAFSLFSPSFLFLSSSLRCLSPLPTFDYLYSFISVPCSLRLSLFLPLPLKSYFPDLEILLFTRGPSDPLSYTQGSCARASGTVPEVKDGAMGGNPGNGLEAPWPACRSQGEGRSWLARGPSRSPEAPV